MFHDYEPTPALLKMHFTFNPNAEVWARNRMPLDATDGGICLQWWDEMWNRGELVALYSKNMVRNGFWYGSDRFAYFNQFKGDERKNTTGGWYKFSRNATQQDLTNTTETCLEMLTLMRETIK